jgi:hypothetical protein
VRHVAIAVPAYAGTVYLSTLRSLLHDLVALAGRGDRFSLLDYSGSAIIADARAEICAHFLALGDASDLVFVDHDVCWEAGALLRLLDHPVDMVAGVYPHRKDPLTFPVAWTDAEELWADPETGLLEASGVPGGFLRVTRKAIAAMSERYADLEYETDRVPGGKAVGLFEPYRIGKRKLSEDYSFCRRWRDMGGKVWVDPEIRMGHTGPKLFPGCLGDELRKNL